MSTYYGDVDDNYLQLLAKLLEQTKRRSYELMHIQPGARVLDVGCGTGMDTIALGQLVGPSGHVVGVDVDRAFLALADQRAAEAGVQGWVSHRHANATRLPFADGSFDACRCERLLQHLAEPEQAVAEMVRVTRPGGAIVVLDPDWGTLSVDTPEVEIGRRLVRFETDTLRSGFSGRQLYRLLRRQQLVDLEIESLATHYTSYAFADQVLGLAEQAQAAVRQGAIGEEEGQRWLASLAAADAEGVFFATLTGVMIGARKPA